jgi:hypothetical protein
MSLEFATPAQRADKAFVLAAVTQDGLELEFTTLKDDYSISLASVLQNGLALEFTTFKDDYDIVFSAVAQNGLALAFTTMEINKVIAFAAVTNNLTLLELGPGVDPQDTIQYCLDNIGITLSLDSENIPNSQVVVISYGGERMYSSFTVENNIGTSPDNNDYNGLSLQYLPSVFQDDYDIVKYAVKNNGLSLQFASITLRGNAEIVALAVAQNPEAIQFEIPEIEP